MIEEESYSMLYLYNALIEYIYFLIILIQDKGPNNLSNIAKHVRFFKKDVYVFIQIFNGKNLTDKVGQMLCSTTSVFEIKDDVLYLSNNYLSFKQIIYEDFLMSKVVDLILRGICSVRDICQNLNFNSIIAIKEDTLVAMLKYYSYFYLDKNSSVVLLRFHGLVGFEKHIYHTTVKYFQSCLQYTNVLSFNDIKLHSSCIPSCAARNSLVIFCILHISLLFKCKNSKISLRNRLKRKRHCEQVLNMEKIESKISSNSVSVGLLVYEVHGPMVSNWTGEISSLKCSSGEMQCVVNFSNGHQGIFDLYFYKTALKYACEIGDLRNFLNVCDIVEFDAEFLGKTAGNDVYWQATRIKVTDRILKGYKYELNLDTDKYMENVNLNCHKFKPLSKVCSITNCLVEYTVLEEEKANNNKSLLEFNLSDCKNENIPKKEEPNEYEDVLTYYFPDKLEIRQTCSESLISNCDDTNNTSTVAKPPIHRSILDDNSDGSLKVDSRILYLACVGYFNKSKTSQKHSTKKCMHGKDLPNAVAAPNETIVPYEVKNENKYSIIPPNLPKECIEENSWPKVVTAPNEAVISYESKYLMVHPKLPKKCIEENDLLNLVAASNEIVVPHEVKSEDKCIIQPKLPRKCTEKNGWPKAVAAPNEAVISHEIKNKSKYLMVHPKLPKKCIEGNDLLNLVAVPNEIVVPCEVISEDKCFIHPKLPNKCTEENGWPNVLSTAANKTTMPREVKNIIIHHDFIPNTFNTSTFMLGEVDFISTFEGVAYSTFKNKIYEIFFKKDDILFQNGATNVLVKGSKVLLFIPYVELGESLLTATLIYPLTSKETIEIQKKGFRVQDFIVNNFSQRVKNNLLCDTQICNCDLSKSLLVGTQLQPNFKNHTKTSLKYSEFIQKLNDLYQLSEKTHRNLCSLVNRVHVQDIGESCKKLLKLSPFSLVKSLSKIRHSSGHALYKIKKKIENRFKFNKRKCKHPSLQNAHIENCSMFLKKPSFPNSYKEDCDNDTGSIFYVNIPTILLKSSSLEQPCSIEDNSKIAIMPNKKLLTTNLIKQSCLRVSHKSSSSSVCSFSSYLDDSAKESDDVFYSCESDFDPSPTEHLCPESKHACQIDINSLIVINGISDKSPTNSFTNKCSDEDVSNIELIGPEEKRSKKCDGTSLYLKLGHFSLPRRRKKKTKVFLPSKNNLHKTCYHPSIETTAEICIINKSNLYFKVQYKQQNATLAFPMCLIPAEMQINLKLNSIIKVTFVPHLLIHLSRVLYVKVPYSCRDAGKI